MNQSSSVIEPFADGIEGYARRLRAGETSVEQCVSYCLQRIAEFDPHLQAFQALDAESALNNARAQDKLLASGTDLGPLMGVPIAIKDIIAVDGFPTTNGSLFDPGLPGPHQGPVVERLRRAGCIVLGKTKTVEFALGATGLNSSRGTPWNPWDMAEPRIPGGSSSGSAVAVAAGFVAFALGSDTGGSIRIPACYTGLFGHKTTVGLWPTQGVFPLSPTLDSLGPLCRTAADAAQVHQVVTGKTLPAAHPSLAGIRLGVPSEVFFDDLDESVTAAFNSAVDQLRQAGVIITPLSLPEAQERATLFPKIVPPELIQALTPEGFDQAAAQMDAVTRERAEVGLSVSAHDYIAAKARMNELQVIAEQKLSGLDGWISPTCPFPPMTLASLDDPQQHERSLQSSRNTQPGNLMGLCAMSMPIQQLTGHHLPIGLQLMMSGGKDDYLLALSQCLQSELGTGTLPSLT